MTHLKPKQRILTTAIVLLLFLSIFTFPDRTAQAASSEGWVHYEGEWYFYEADVKQTGWLQDNGVWYFLDPDHNGAMVRDGLMQDGGQWYYMDASGRMIQSGWYKVKSGELQGKWIMTYASGVIRAGWYKEGGNWYFLYPQMASDEYLVSEGKTYYFYSNGACHLKEGWFRYNSDKYGRDQWSYANKDGSLKNGWLKYNNKWYYFRYTMVRNGVTGIDDQYYYFEADGSCRTQEGWLKTEDKDLNLTYWFYVSKGGPLKTGWLKYNNNWYYLDPEMYKSGVFKVGESDYFFDASGICRTQESWVKVTAGGNTFWYYVQKGGVLKTGWFKYYNKWYYFEPKMLTNGTYEIGRKNYTFDANGVWVP